MTIAGEEPQRVFAFSGQLFALDDWSPDGRWIFYHDAASPTIDARRIDRLETPPIVAARALAGVVDQGQLSPDGRWLAYNAGESGRHEWRRKNATAEGAMKEMRTRSTRSFEMLRVLPSPPCPPR